MAKEIEKKFLIINDNWKGQAEGNHYCQGYLNNEDGRTVRVRTIGNRGILTIKGPNVGGEKLEYEYDIPFEDATEMLEKLCHKPLIQKKRYKISYRGFTWEVDEFEGENQGLLFAEIELEYVGQAFDSPDWIGKEVTDDGRYYNANLVKNPYCNWQK